MFNVRCILETRQDDALKRIITTLKLTVLASAVRWGDALVNCLGQHAPPRTETATSIASQKDGRAWPVLGDVPCVTILLCCYNGARFLSAQLASIKQQSHRNWHLVVSDDGSTDATLNILENFARCVPQKVELRAGPRCGPCANFLSLATDPSIAGDYYAFCDQDDIWHRDKLKHAVGWLQSGPQSVSAVYCTRTRLMGEAGRAQGYSPLFSKQPSFANALVQSIAGANTMVFNHATKYLLEKAGPVDVVSHDWWTYQLISGAGGVVHYEKMPHLDYRQHSANQIGCNTGLRARWRRIRKVFGGGFARWNHINLRALDQCRHLLTSDSRSLLDTYHLMRSSNSLCVRLKTLFKSGIRRQTLGGNIGILTAVALKKL